MNRRNFLKSIATVCGAAVVCPDELLKSPVRHIGIRGERAKYITMGITNEQLCELIRATLKDLPPMMFEDAFVGVSVKCTAAKCYRKYLGQNRCHNCLWNTNDVPTTKLILRKQKFPCGHPSWPELVEVPIDYCGEEWLE